MSVTLVPARSWLLPPDHASACALERSPGCCVTKTDRSQWAGTTVTWWPESLTRWKRTEVDRGFPGKVPDGCLMEVASGANGSTSHTASVFSNMAFPPSAQLLMLTKISSEPPFYSPSFGSFPLVTECSPRCFACDYTSARELLGFWSCSNSDAHLA